MIKSRKLYKQKKISHGFFNRNGGKSVGIYRSLNCGPGSNDNKKRSIKMRKQMIIEGFGQCSNNLECEAVCPKEISADWISWMNKI